VSARTGDATGRLVADEYRMATFGVTVWMVRPGDAGDLERSGAPRILEGKGRRASGPGRGRGAMTRLTIAGREAIGKRALHGGLLGPLLGGVYLGHGRVEAVAHAALRLRAAGVATPDVIAAGWRPIVRPFYALALLTEMVPDAMSLQECLLASPPTPGRRRALLRAAGETVRAMHGAGFRHADLNLANLVVEGGPGSPRVHVIDLDGGRFATGTRDRAAAGNLCRLVRSWEKFIEPRVSGGLRDLVAFLRGYTADPARRRRLAEALIRHRARLWARRVAWRRRS
jgi:tRNA A-37 threonylcarbamoyl transferase component Bud32